MALSNRFGAGRMVPSTILVSGTRILAPAGNLYYEYDLLLIIALDPIFEVSSYFLFLPSFPFPHSSFLIPHTSFLISFSSSSSIFFFVYVFADDAFSSYIRRNFGRVRAIHELVDIPLEASIVIEKRSPDTIAR